MIRIGTAGWAVPATQRADFPERGTHLQRYAQRFNAVEINSSFYRPHKPDTYARWAASVPPGFRFAVKLPREITHNRRLVDVTTALACFLSQAQALGDRLGPLLVQLPPSLGFEAASSEGFLDQVRGRFTGFVACEPRHASWFTDTAEVLLRRYRIARVAADPAPVPLARHPGGWPGFVYHRLHGSPRMYYSAYPPDCLDATADLLRATATGSRPSWCIFDNTALGAATGDAFALQRRLEPAG